MRSLADALHAHLVRLAAENETSAWLDAPLTADEQALGEIAGWGLVSELELTSADDGVPSDCVVNFDNIHTIPRAALRRRVVQLSAPRMAPACRCLRDAMGC